MKEEQHSFIIKFNSLELRKIKLIALYKEITMQQLIKKLILNNLSLDEMYKNISNNDKLYVNKKLEVNEIITGEHDKTKITITGIEEFSTSEIREILYEAFINESPEAWVNNR